MGISFLAIIEDIFYKILKTSYESIDDPYEIVLGILDDDYYVCIIALYEEVDDVLCLSGNVFGYSTIDLEFFEVKSFNLIGKVLNDELLITEELDNAVKAIRRIYQHIVRHRLMNNIV